MKIELIFTTWNKKTLMRFLCDLGPLKKQQSVKLNQHSLYPVGVVSLHAK